MGVRPSIYLVIGVCDLVENDSRFLADTILSGDDLYEKIPVFWKSSDGLLDDEQDLYYQENRIYSLAELVYNPSNAQAHVCKNVTGLVIDSMYDTDIFRALSLVDKKFSEKGFSVIPELDVEKYPSRKRHGYTDDDALCHRFVDSVLSGSSPIICRTDWERALFYLKQCGYSFNENELRYILVWHWA